MKKKKLTLAIAVVLVALVAVGGTLAWLMDNSGPVINTFTYGDINIELYETEGVDENGDPKKVEQKEYKMVPGNVLDKDPTVVVKKGSEDCWLFVQVDIKNNETASGKKFLNYGVRTGWTPLEGKPGVYYRTVDANEEDQTFYILKSSSDYGVGDQYPNGAVVVYGDVVKSDIEALKASNELPTITFNAYAVQRDENISTPAAAWNVVEYGRP